MYYDKASFLNASETTHSTGEKFPTRTQRVTGFTGRFEADEYLPTLTAYFVKKNLFTIRRKFIEILDDYFQCIEEEMEIRIKSCGWM